MDKQRFIEIDGQQIPVTEEVYRAYKRPLWRERKEKERAKRCRDENGNRCTKSCRECPKLHDGGDLSLDKFSDDGFDIADEVDIHELVADKLLLEQLVSCLDELEPDERSLIDALFYSDRTERDYATEIGISHQAIGKRKKKVIDKLRDLMGVGGDK
jgi:RNA polymerase sigma factor (sigma-70 family)